MKWLGRWSVVSGRASAQSTGGSTRSGRVHRGRRHRRERKCRRGAGGVSGTLPGADVRGFYGRWGSRCRGWAAREGRRGALRSRARRTAGGAARRATRMTRRSHAAVSPGRAIDLMIAHGLTTRRAGPPERAGALGASSPSRHRPATIDPLTTSRAHRHHVSWRPVSRSWRRPANVWLGWSGRRGCCGRAGAGVLSRDAGRAGVRVGARSRDHPDPKMAMASCAAFCATRLPMTVCRRCWRCAARG